MNSFDERTYEDLTDDERWEIIEEMTCNMDEDEREEYLEGLGE